MSQQDSTNNPVGNQAKLTWDEEGRPVSSEFDDVYFSKANGLEETRFVFLQHNYLPERWQTLTNQDHFVIAETGFGTGLNFLAAWQLWQQQAPTEAQLHFISVEMFPVGHSDLQTALALWPELAPLAQQLIDNYPQALTPGFHRLSFDNGRVQLTLIIGEASDSFSQLLASPHPAFEVPQHRVDAWFLDGFAPAKNPDMWSQSLFDLIARLSAPEATAATFTCAGIVKRGLKSAGFTIEKVPGFGRKREMLRAKLSSVYCEPEADSFAEGPFNSPHPAPWWVHKSQPTTQKSAIVIGGGIAGCHSAHALAKRGWQVTLLERHSQLATEGSGNPQGVLYAKLSAKTDNLGDFNLTALQYAQRVYQPYWQAAGSQCGVLQLSEDANSQAALIERLGQQTLQKALVRNLDRQQASEIAGIELLSGGLFFQQAGWLNPAKVCQQLTTHSNINVTTHAEVTSLTYDDGQWQTLNAAGKLLAHAPTVVIATANDALQLPQSNYLPLKPVRGQVSYLTANDTSSQLNTVLCGEGYIAPAHQGQHCLGASFGPKQSKTDLRQQDHGQNLQRLAPLSEPLLQAFQPTPPLQGRASVRATTPDYLPMVGPVSDPQATRERFALLRKNAKASINATIPSLPGLFVNVGHGSRGLCYTPLCSELLASQINGDPPPLGWQSIRALHPSRFLIRDLIRNK
ncbi:bifunctional tRNA (5-methylaminomethyl-2-thiouridine)(34)-methyltransferase MnmD/FAD-dependent 5-carboxymethylaminomethyl-2-thiouridine(34) oxidoreductase MnmC [Maricurvus nonylphenolicus]|uniref:bifunctional tRNA (5-methylaminomethyl-2-thiouridine)(34)-methyltransferase MnmD/FAD-dependent 5-carboxymethylaminomethyl-2-thiouridine(34) oxidoreductase MnmC n=1 Tax=Maricurvus nonylphenolicus TaxID=1008307 RepID=UPI0036F2BD13